MSDSTPKSTVGPRIFVESLLTPEEWRENNRKYPNTCRASYPVYFKSDMDWRYGMGKGYSKEEISKINANLEEIRKFLKKKQEEDDKSNVQSS